MRSRTINMKFVLVFGGGAVFLVAAIWLLAVRFEGQKPAIELSLTSPAFGSSRELSLTVADPKSGLRHIRVGLLHQGKETLLYEKQFSGSFLSGGRTMSETMTVAVEPKKLGIADGKGKLRLDVRDYAWRGWWRGNRAVLEKEIYIDTVAPEIEVLSHQHNVAQGGTGLVIYKLSESCRESGVVVGESFFPGQSGYFSDEKIYLAFFGLGIKHSAQTPLHLQAVDYAGNRVQAGFLHHIIKKRFKKDQLRVSEKFFKWKVPEFDRYFPEAPGISLSGEALAQRYLKINRDIRKDNYTQIAQIARESEARLRWRGSFLRLPNSARRAGFGDGRTYNYKGHPIDRQTHMGIDLASLAKAPVPAANSGKVLFAGTMGIYGKSVILDHGFGLMSMYAHLSALGVKAGQTVARGDIIGKTGKTGLAGGDHLHFGVLIHHVFVNPVEWWDAAWIKNNVMNKIEAIAGKK